VERICGRGGERRACGVSADLAARMTKMTHTCPECGDVSIAWAVHECWVVRKEQTQERLEPPLVTKVADADDNPQWEDCRVAYIPPTKGRP
jgi:predicted RNA-binding Zn-ribbon protein involved in translation (DUF1610 family)